MNTTGLWILMFILQLVTLNTVAEEEVHVFQFSRTTICDGTTGNSGQCMRQVGRGVQNSLLRCGARCSGDDSCTGFSLDRNLTASCYLHSWCTNTTDCNVADCNVGTDCNVLDTRFQYFAETSGKRRKPCFTGTYNETTKTCVCNNSWSGDFCDRRHHNCSDFYNYHKYTFGYYTLKMLPPGYSSELDIVCCITKFDIRTVFFRNSGELDFNRTWKEYTDGFDNRTSSRWIGLNNMRYFLSRASAMNLGFKSEFGSKLIEIQFASPIIGDASTNYTLQVFRVSGTQYTSPGDCMSSSNNTQFSTWNSAHGKDLTDSCVQEAGVGWWFPYCNFKCNPLGIFYNGTRTPPTDKGYAIIPGVNQTFAGSRLTRIEMYMNEIK